jgi:4-amino-4-deoxy-L-arabinose transferase-like glycosyltransferase
LLAAALSVFGTGNEGLRAGALEWWALASTVPLFAWRLGRRLLGPGPGAVTAGLVAVYPPFILYGGFFSSEIPALAFLTGSLWLGYRARDAAGRVAVGSAVGAGILGGLALANRPQFVLNLAVVAIPLLMRRRVARTRFLALAAGACVVLVAVVAHNTAATGHLTGLSTNGGLNFFQSHCDVRLVTAGSPERGGVFVFGSPVPYARNEGRNYRFPDREVWDQGFFFSRGMACVRRDGLGHVGVLAQNLLDATATTVPWPLENPGGGKELARWSNLLYSLLLPVIVVATLMRMRRRRSPGERQLLLQLACLVPVLLVFDSEPRFRVPYDVFGLALLASLLWGVWSAVRSQRADEV